MLRLFDNRDDRSRRGERTVRQEELGIDGSKIAGRAHMDSVCPKNDQRSCGLGLVRDDHGQFTAAGSRLANEPQGGLTVAAKHCQHDV